MSRSTLLPLLPLLADGQFRSGQDLAHVLGVSRTAVWKQLKRIADDCGLEVESVRGKGYRIAGGIDLLDEESVRAALVPEAAALLGELLILDSVDSTNAEVMRRLHCGPANGLVCSAEQQSAGRGRRGRTWVSPYASNIYLSLAWEFDQGAAALEGLSLAVGVAAVRALKACGVQGVQLKWPNDILHDGAKLGGILLEMTGDAAGTCQVVVGLGLNVAMPASAAADIDQQWTDLKSICADRPPARSALLAALLNELLPLVAGFQVAGFGPWREQWLALDAHADKAVVLDTGSQKMAGTARGVDDRGALQLETTTGTQAIYGGEITMRRAS
jgi:BirA family biotin operon repressor/biotin-[acetyl-CoA-carboxylase] ligase